MRGLDTNVLVRYLTADDAKQTALAEKLLEQASERDQPLFIPVLVLCELVWVLARSWRSIDSSIHNIAEISPSEAGCDLGTSTQKQD